MKASPQRAREKRITRAIVVTQSICVKWNGGEGNLKRSVLKTATSEPEVLHKNRRKLVRKNLRKRSSNCTFPSGGVLGEHAHKEPGKAKQ